MDAPGSEILFTKDSFVFTQPKLIQLGNFCVRDFQVHSTPSQKDSGVGPYKEHDDDLVSCMEIEDNFDLQITKTGKFLVEFYVASAFYGNIIGSRGITRHKIEQDTRTSIKVPRHGETGNIVITGKNERDVITAKNRIELVIWQARDKHPFTHFVSVPMVSDMIKHNFDIFKSSILSGTLIRGLDVSMFQNPNKMHLTVVPLVLVDDVEKDKAVKALHRCKKDVIEPLLANIEPLRIILKGLEIMNDDPANVDVLYGKISVDPPKYNDCFQKVTDGIVDCLADEGLIRKQYENVKLHVTLINSLFRKAEQKQKREPFDASMILQKHRNFYFGEVSLDFIHLSVRFTTSEGAYYDALMTVSVK